jgi:hypothetical protein
LTKPPFGIKAIDKEDPMKIIASVVLSVFLLAASAQAQTSADCQCRDFAAQAKQAADAVRAYLGSKPSSSQSPIVVLYDLRQVLNKAAKCQADVAAWQWWYPTAVARTWRVYAERSASFASAYAFDSTATEKGSPCKVLQDAQSVVDFAAAYGAIVDDAQNVLDQATSRAAARCSK